MNCLKCMLDRRERPRPNRTITAVVLMAVMMLGGVAFANPDLNDQTITNAVENEILYDQAVKLNNVDISVTNGVVTLTGETDNLLAKKRAARIARTIRGVRSVVNRVKVNPALIRVDSALSQDVNDALLSNPATESYEIQVKASLGTITLSGRVESWQEKQFAEKVASSVRGVRSVKNTIKVDYPEERMDHEIKADVEEKLKWDTLVDHELIDVKVDDGEVTLTGTVGSSAEKQIAAADAWVTGTEHVDATDLTVAYWARDEKLRKEKYVTRSDKEIREAVESAMLYDPRVASFEITPEVHYGHVTLRGTVDHVQAKRAAEQDARNTVGVFRVYNRIKVRATDEIEDAQIAAKVRDALRRDPYVEKYEIDVSVDYGVVTLDGEVDSYFEKSQADTVASSVEGVIVVDNDLAVDLEDEPLVYDPYVDPIWPYTYPWYDYDPSPTIKSDAHLLDDVQDELWWSPFVDSDDVNVAVDDGVVTLTGTVDSWSEYNAATENAYEGGAIWVDNDLAVEIDED